MEWTVKWLQSAGWEVIPEVTFQVRGERGSIDVLSRHGNGAMLVIEVKSVVPDIQALLSSLDRKVRLAAEIGRERGWPAGARHGSRSCPPTGQPDGGLRPFAPRSEPLCRTARLRRVPGSLTPTDRSRRSYLCQT